MKTEENKIEGLINYNHFAKMVLKVGQIINVEDVEGKDRVYKLTIDLNENEPRTLVAGLKLFYKKEELKNKKVIVVANLEPRKIAGFLSKGMLLAASTKKDNKEIVSLLQPDKDMPVGSDIY